MDLKRLPRRTADLAIIPQRYHDAYRPDDERGGFILVMAHAQLIHDATAEIATLNQQIAQATKVRDDVETRRRTDLAHKQLMDELDAAGIEPRWHRAVAAMISDGVESFELSDAGTCEIAMAQTLSGMQSLGELVTAFLISDEGEPFRSAPLASEGHFAAMVAAMKRAR